MSKKKQDRRKQKEPPEPILIVIPRNDPLTQLILGGPTREERIAEYLKTHKTLPPPWPWPKEERGRERSDNDSSDRDDNKRQEIVVADSSSEEMVLEPSEALEPSNMLADTSTNQPIVASQNADNSSPIRCSAGSPQDLTLLQQLTNVDASIAQLNASITQLLVVKAYLTAQLPACMQVETAPPPSAPMQPVPTVHGPVAAMQTVPLVQQPEQAQPQPSADTGHVASAPLPPVQPPSSTRPPKQPRWTSVPPRGRTSYAAVAAAAAAAAAFASQPSWREGAPRGCHAAAASSSFASTFHVRRNFVLKAPPGSLPDSAASLKDRLMSFLVERLPGAPLPISDAVLLGSQAASTRVFFSLDSLEAADALVGRRGALKASGVSIQDFLTPEEIKTKRALWPRFLEAKARGQRPQFHRARLVVS